jgi:ascorbate-specific PTS system EIIC-type component UlaA
MLIAGAIFLVAGGSLLLRTTGFLTANFSLWPVVLVLIGLLLLHRVYFKQGADAHVFSGIFLILVGAFLLVLNAGVLESDFKQFWPLFMLFTGVSLFFFGLKKKGSSRVRMTIPALAIVLLSLFFLLFSLRIVSVSLRRFVVIWWPGMLIFAGAMLIILDLLVEHRQRKNPPDDTDHADKNKNF